jgi:hypothetical protein
MNELRLGDVSVTRIEELHGPIMPPDQFFPQMPAEAWREHRERLVPDHLRADRQVLISSGTRGPDAGGGAGAAAGMRGKLGVSGRPA